MAMTAREELASATMVAMNDIVKNLGKAKSALESLVIDMRDFTCLMTCEGRIIWGNEQAATWIGCERDTLHHQYISSLLSEQNWQQFKDKLAKFASAGRLAQQQEFQMPIHQGEGQREIFWNIRPFLSLTDRRGLVLLLVGRDITEVLRERTERVKLESELETAQFVQSAFFPPNHIRKGKIEISTFYRAAEQCSGDWWGYFNLSDDLELVCIADVAGHGAASALVTAMTQATCMSFVAFAKEKQDYSGTSHFPAALLKQINQIVCDTFKGDCFVSCLALLLNTRDKVLIACNAGHNQPFLLHGKSRQEALGDPNYIEKNGPFAGLKQLGLVGDLIGFDRNTEFTEQVMPLSHLDRFVLYTDGLIECKNSTGSMYGARKLRKSIARGIHQDANTSRDTIINLALDYYGAVPCADDVTLVQIDLLLE